MGVNTTVKANLKKPEVLQALLEADLEMSLIEAKLRFKVIATIDPTLEGQPGDKINVIAYNYLGSADDLGEGVEITMSKLTAKQKISPVIKKAAKGIEITDEAVLSAFGDPVGEAKKQIELAIRDKLDKDIIATLDSAPMESDNKAAIIGYTPILKATGMFQDEEEQSYIMFIHPDQKIDLMADSLFEKAQNLKDEFLTEGAIGRIGSCDVIVSRRITLDGTKAFWTNYICKKDAVKILTKRGLLVEVDRDIKKQQNDVVATSHYVTWLEYGDRVVKMLNKKGYVSTKPDHLVGFQDITS